MMRRVEIGRGERLTEETLRRSGGVDAEIIGVAARIVDDVKERGDAALREYTAKFDQAELDVIAVTPEEIAAAVEEVGPEFRDAMTSAAGAIEDFHARQVTQSWFTAQEGGVFLGQRVTPIRRVGHLRPRRTCLLPEHRAHERDPSPGGGCR